MEQDVIALTGALTSVSVADAADCSPHSIHSQTSDYVNSGKLLCPNGTFITGFAEYEAATMKCQWMELHEHNHEGVIFAEYRLLILDLQTEID